MTGPISNLRIEARYQLGRLEYAVRPYDAFATSERRWFWQPSTLCGQGISDRRWWQR